MDGGVTGIAILLQGLFEIDISILILLLSAPFLILGHFTVSKSILAKSLFSIIALSLFIYFENFQTITEDKLLIAIFGGLFVGMGLGITIRNGAVLDGSEILGIFINDRFGISIGSVILVFNVILFSITSLVLSIEIALYSILTFMVTAKVTDFIIEGFEDFIGVMIISRNEESVRKAILEQLGAGLTLYQGERGFGKDGEEKELKIIHSVINRIDIRKMHRILDALDPDAFMVEYDINNIRGGVLRRYLEKKKQ